jgi:hypothetical protein
MRSFTKECTAHSCAAWRVVQAPDLPVQVGRAEGAPSRETELRGAQCRRTRLGRSAQAHQAEPSSSSLSPPPPPSPPGGRRGGLIVGRLRRGCGASPRGALWAERDSTSTRMLSESWCGPYQPSATAAGRKIRVGPVGGHIQEFQVGRVTVGRHRRCPAAPALAGCRRRRCAVR